MNTRDVCAEYAAGLWVPAYHGLQFRIAKRNARVRQAVASGWSETDPSRTFATLADAQAAADARNQEAV